MSSHDLLQQKRGRMIALVGVVLLFGLLTVVAIPWIAHSEPRRLGDEAISGLVSFVAEHHKTNSYMHELENANQTTREAHLRDSHQHVREHIIKMKSSGKSIQEIKDAGYTKHHLGCKSRKNEEEALDQCLAHLKTAFTPLELGDLLGMESDHELKMLVDAGVAPKMGGWTKGAKVLVCYTKGTKEGCYKRTVRAVSDDKIKLRHLEVDPKTGTTERGDYKFQVYSFSEWEDSASEGYRAHADLHKLDGSNATTQEANLRDSREKVRQSIIKMKSSGKSIQEIKDAGYTKGNLGCKSHEDEAEALSRCLAHLKAAFTPLELVELLEMKSEHELKMLVDAGVAPKTGDWTKGEEVLVCHSNGTKEGCFKRTVSAVSDDKIKLRHLEVDPKTGTTESGDYRFKCYSFEDWAKE